LRPDLVGGFRGLCRQRVHFDADRVVLERMRGVRIFTDVVAAFGEGNGDSLVAACKLQQDSVEPIRR
jgi:hypothetical protein